MDFTWPYCEVMRQRVMRALEAAGEAYVPKGVYATAQGPRLETAAEIDRMERDGASMVGMTGMPEAALAKELDLCYAAIAVSVNSAAGRGASTRSITIEEIGPVIERAMTRVRRVLEFLVAPEACGGRA
jgi:5'-methylthioadenosine phosphorylase